jgi:cysteine desulfurase
MQSIYLDHNSTTPLAPEAAAAMAGCQHAGYANPESQHQPGRRARQMLEEARDEISRILGADLSGRTPDRLIFTSGGTEANNLALFGLAGLWSGGPAGRIVISAIEHPSVSRPAEALEQRGWQVDRLGAGESGVVCVEQFAALLDQKPRLASVMLANNETGVIQPVGQLAELSGAAEVPLHTDACQAVGKIAVNFRQLGVAAMSVAAHKFHGPRGIGVLIVLGEMALEPMLFGGFQQQGFRPGTEPVALAVGMAAALAAFEREREQRKRRVTSLRDRLAAALVAAWPMAVVIGANSERLPNTACIAFPGLDRRALVMALDLAGVACSTGSACASGSSEPSPTLVAMGLPADVVAGALRFSLAATTTVEEINEAAHRIADCLRTMPRAAP